MLVQITKSSIARSLGMELSISQQINKLTNVCHWPLLLLPTTQVSTSIILANFKWPCFKNLMMLTCFVKKICYLNLPNVIFNLNLLKKIQHKIYIYCNLKFSTLFNLSYSQENKCLDINLQYFIIIIMFDINF